MIGLETHDRLFGERPIAPIDRTWRVARPSQATLQRPHKRRPAQAVIAAADGQYLLTAGGAARDDVRVRDW
jgi:hypothetical protein